MARRKRANPHETQARISLWLAIVGSLGCLALIAFVLPKLDWGEFAIQYMERGRRFFAIVGAAFVAAAASAIGFFVALNSAGQKRNELSNLAWKTFFVNAIVLTLTLCVFVIFWFARDPVFRLPG